MRSIGVIGGGRFGSTLAVSLAQQGIEVLFMDKDRSVVQHMSDVVTKAVQGDAADREALSEAGFGSCDVVVVAMGSNLEACILATMALKELNVAKVIAKASSENAGKVLARVGADQVTYPERDRALRLARTLTARTILDYIQVSPGTGIVEVQAPEKFIGRPLAETRIRSLYGLTVLEIRRGQGDQSIRITGPSGDDVVTENDTLVLFGSDENLRRFEKEIR
jgi:trk system potassium uptake protein TrkA